MLIFKYSCPFVFDWSKAKVKVEKQGLEKKSYAVCFWTGEWKQQTGPAWRKILFSGLDVKVLYILNNKVITFHFKIL